MKKTLLTITIAFLLFFGVVMAKNCLSVKLPNNAMGIQAVIQKGSVDTLFIGASSFRKGINMHTVEDQLAGSSFMVAYNGNQPLNMDIELTQITDAGVIPKTLIVEFDPAMISNHADLSDKRLLWDIDMNEKIRLWKHLKDREDADFFMMYDYFVSSNIDYMFTYPVSYPLISKRYYLGGNNGEEYTSSKSKEELDALPVDEDAGLNELQKESVLHIIDICRNNGIRLIFAESPNYVKMYDDSNYAEKQEILENLLIDNGVTVFTAKDYNFDYSNPEFYSDLTHMSSKGMEEYTKELLNKVSGF